MFASGTGDYPTSLSGAAVIKTTEGTFKLLYKSDESSDVKISIFDKDMRLVFTEKIRNTTGFARPYSFENLDQGNYTVAIQDNAGTTVQKISTLPAETSKLVNVLKLNNGESKYLLTVGGKGDETLILNIYDGQRQLVYSETKSIRGDFAQVYNLSKVRGTPSFEILHQNGSLESIEY
jgi:hypothetical protein